jgi:hypothetical protein
MKFFSIVLALTVGVLAADYLKQGAVAGLSLSQQQICR